MTVGTILEKLEVIDNPMDSERKKREKEIARLLSGTPSNDQPDVGFREEIRKAASLMFEKETSKIQRTERVEPRKRFINLSTFGVWLLVLGIGVAFSLPSLGAVMMLAGIAALAWNHFNQPSKRRGQDRQNKFRSSNT